MEPVERTVLEEGIAYRLAHEHAEGLGRVVTELRDQAEQNEMYELRIAYNADTTLGEADVRSRHEHIDEAAEAFARCSAPLKRLIWVEDGEPDFLDEAEHSRLVDVCARHGLEVAEVEG